MHECQDNLDEYLLDTALDTEVEVLEPKITPQSDAVVYLLD